MTSAEKLISKLFIEAFPKADYELMEKLLAKNLIAYVTNPQAGVDKVQGRDAYMKKIRALDIPSISKGSITIPQILTVKPNQVFVMVDIKVERNGKLMHNHAAYLANVKNNQISEMWMVEALPAYSAEFWLG